MLACLSERTAAPSVCGGWYLSSLTPSPDSHAPPPSLPLSGSEAQRGFWAGAFSSSPSCFAATWWGQRRWRGGTPRFLNTSLTSRVSWLGTSGSLLSGCPSLHVSLEQALCLRGTNRISATNAAYCPASLSLLEASPGAQLMAGADSANVREEARAAFQPGCCREVYPAAQTAPSGRVDRTGGQGEGWQDSVWGGWGGHHGALRS